MPIDLYYISGSPPCRAARLGAAAVGVNINLKDTDVKGDEHLKPEFMKMSPQHTVPTLDDNGFYLSESRAIMSYLVDQYGKNDSLYPKDIKKRALVDQLLYFDIGTLYERFANAYYPMIFAGLCPDQTKFSKLGDALSSLEKYLEGANYVAGKTLTIADLALVVTINNFKVMNYDLSKYSNILRWHSKIQAEAPKYNEIEGEEIIRFKEFVDSMTKKK